MNPDLPPIREFTGPRADAVDTMLREVVADSRPAVRAPRRLVPVLVGALVAGGAVAGASLAHQVFAPATDRSLARCHTTADLGRGNDFPGTAVAAADRNGNVTIDRAVDACADLWRQGLLTAGTDKVGEPNPDGRATVPALVGCVDPDGIAAVFPGGPGLCASLGLTALTRAP